MPGRGRESTHTLKGRAGLLTSVRAVSAVGVEVVVTHAKKSLSAFAEVHQSVGAGLEHRLAVKALVVEVALVFVS